MRYQGKLSGLSSHYLIGLLQMHIYQCLGVTWHRLSANLNIFAQCLAAKC